jgi:hypothetical protein
MRSARMLVALVALGITTTMPVAAQQADDSATLSGQIVVAGRCPVPLGGDDSCPDRPFPTTVLIRSGDGQQQVASVPTADDGTFSIDLQPGQYRVDPILSDGNPPAVSTVVVDVPVDAAAPLTLRIRGGTVVRVP